MAHAEGQDEGPSLPNIALGSMVGECLVSVLDEMEGEAKVNPENRKKVVAAFETAFAEEMSNLPRFWHVAVTGNLQQFNLVDQERTFEVREASVDTPVASFDKLPLRINGILHPEASKRRRRNTAHWD
mmetsp:Transcript_52078/g.63780  ORF Transcript_52078/g.63780 Transcript_52078/m.63780 type:complete len:128 (-) Transcript_52078:6-389(-)